MNIKQIYDYYAFGHDYSNLMRGKEGSPNKKIISSIEIYMEFIKEHNLKVTLTVVEKKLDEFKKKLLREKVDATISPQNSKELSEIIHFADATLDAELKLREAYILTEKRMELRKLLENVKDLFPLGIYENLPDLSKYDFSEAGKCIAFERPTAAAFHILRGCEGMLKFYYLFILKIEKGNIINWGEMIKALREKDNVPKTLLDELDTIRINFRNPTDHPEMIYTLDEVQGLFNLCIDAVSRIVLDYNTQKSKIS